MHECSGLIWQSIRLWLVGCLWAGSLLLTSGSLRADESIDTATASEIRSGKVLFEFADSAKAREILQSDDDFSTRLSRFDLQSRMQSSEAVTLASYKQFVGQHVVDWNSEQKRFVASILTELSASLDRLSVTGLPTVQLIQTTGREEGGAAYTRSNAIMLTKAQLKIPSESLKQLILHELFHVISRSNPSLRDKLYAILGFKPTGEILLPESLASRRITNPDAPIIQHVLDVKLDDASEAVVAPVLYASSEYDPAKTRSMFGYLTFALMRVKRDSSGRWIAAVVDGQPVMYESSLADFRRQIGRNTNYIIHPEEVLADNFAELMLGNLQLPDPWIPKQMQDLLLTAQ